MPFQYGKAIYCIKNILRWRTGLHVARHKYHAAHLRPFSGLIILIARKRSNIIIRLKNTKINLMIRKGNLKKY